MKITKIFLFLIFFALNSNNSMADNTSIYDFNFVDIDGNFIELSSFIGKPLLLVNTASRCGFTPQYEGLQNLFIRYRETDLTIIAMTSNTFNQEYEKPEDIKKICLVNYNVGFITSMPINVKGDKIHPIFNWLKNEYNNTPKWNFYKFLFDRSGLLLDSWSSITKPDSKKIITKINNLI